MLNFPKDETQELNIGGDLGCTSQFVSFDLFPWYLTPAPTTTLNNTQQALHLVLDLPLVPETARCTRVNRTQRKQD